MQLVLLNSNEVEEKAEIGKRKSGHEFTLTPLSFCFFDSGYNYLD